MNQKILLTLLVLSAIVALSQAGPRFPKQQSHEVLKQARNESILHQEGQKPSRNGGNRTQHASSEERTSLPQQPSQETTLPPQ
jgi:hypothetical protein